MCSSDLLFDGNGVRDFGNDVFHQLANVAGGVRHAPTLRSWLSGSRAGPGPAALTCAPSTTAAALTTLGTGALPGVTGMVGYFVLNPLLRRDMPEGTAPHPEQNLCLITWEGYAPNPRSWQDVPTIFERLERDQGHSHSESERGTPLADRKIGRASCRERV